MAIMTIGCPVCGEPLGSADEYLAEIAPTHCACLNGKRWPRGKRAELRARINAAVAEYLRD